jgi:integrase
MPVLKLSARILGEISAGSKTAFYYDRALKGFGLKVTPHNFRTWFAEYRRKGAGRKASKRRFTIGSASTLTAEQARRAASDILARAALGEDPASERSAARKGLTVSELADAFLSEHVEPKRKGSTAYYYRIILENLVKPKLGNTNASKVAPSDVAKLHLANRRRPYMANRMLAVIGSMYTFGSRRRLVPEGLNPTKGIERFKEQGRERYLSTEEFARLGDALREAETIGIPWDDEKPRSKHAPKHPANRRTMLGPHATGAIRLLMFTGCRLREVLHLRWSEIDLDRGMLRLQDSKTGQKPVILNGPALQVLNNLPRVGEFVIASEDLKKPRADLKRPWRLVSRRAGLSGVRLHDLRHTFASIGAGGGLGLPVIGKLLGHTRASTTQRYAHLDTDPLRRASNAIGDAIAAAMNGERRS